MSKGGEKWEGNGEGNLGRGRTGAKVSDEWEVRSIW